MPQYLPLYDLTRGEIVESIHFGALAVVDSQGQLVAHYGDPTAETYLRSTAKPFQALPFIEAGGIEHYGLTVEETALLCASHSGTDEHVRVVTQIQAKVGITEKDLLCGTHAPGDEQTRERMLCEGQLPTPNRHNCSGKHTGMLAFARMQGLALEDYINPQHPIQIEILKTFAELCGLEPQSVHLGIDGCSAPNFAVPLQNTALGFARLADPSALPQTQAEACRKITHAMMQYPNMVGGPGRFDTLLMQAMGGKLFTKAGAEGYQGVGIMPGALGEGSPALGIALKLSDGDPEGRARPGVVMEALRQLGAVGAEELKELEKFWKRPIYNWRHLTVGETYPAFELAWDRPLHA